VGVYDEIGIQLAEIHEELRAVEQFDADAVDYRNERTSAALERFGPRGDELTFH
jgi:hypothetical protein